MERHFRGVSIEATAISSAQALSNRAIEPQDEIEARRDKSLRRLGLGVRLHKELSRCGLTLTHGGFELLRRLVTAECFLEQFSLSVVAREINEDPTVSCELLEGFMASHEAVALFNFLNFLLFFQIS